MNINGMLGGAIIALVVGSGAEAQDPKWYGAVDLGGLHQNAMTAYFDPRASLLFDNAPALRFHFS